MSEMHNRPMAAKELSSYRYRGDFGWVMIGANSIEQALREASRSITATHRPIVGRLQIWNGKEYVSL